MADATGIPVVAALLVDLPEKAQGSCIIEVHGKEDEQDLPSRATIDFIWLKKNELLVTHGQTGQRTYFVGKGCLRICFISEERQDATRYFAFENQFATVILKTGVFLIS